MKRKLFIGSSSGAGLKIAKRVRALVEKNCGDWLEAELWNRGSVFEINSSFLDSLLRASQRFHYGIFVATKDDPTIKKKKKIVEPRDNVIFEMGLFLGSMGLSRSFLLVEKGVGLPSDLEGITMPLFELGEKGAVAAAVTTIIERIKRTRASFNLKPIPSGTLALGYFENFLKPFAGRYRDKFKDAAQVKVLLPKGLLGLKDKADLNQLIDIYAGLYPSEDVSIYQPGTRPVIKKIKGQGVFWDIPTTIFTLKELFDKLPSGGEIVGIDDQQQQWLMSEVHEFGRSVLELKDQAPAFQLGLKMEVALLEIKGGQSIETPLERL